MNIHCYEINDNEWNRIKDMFPPEHPQSGKRGRLAKYDNRSVMNGILWIARTGAQWRELPERYGKWQAVYARYRLWKQKNLFAFIFCKERHLVECFFQKIKWFRRVFSRYDKLDASFLAFVYIAACMILLQ